MKKIRKIAVEQNFAAISVGKLNELNTNFSLARM